MATPESAHMTGTEASKALGFSACAAICPTCAMRLVAEEVEVELKRSVVRGVRFARKEVVIGRRGRVRGMEAIVVDLVVMLFI